MRKLSRAIFLGDLVIDSLILVLNERCGIYATDYIQKQE